VSLVLAILISSYFYSAIYVWHHILSNNIIYPNLVHRLIMAILVWIMTPINAVMQIFGYYFGKVTLINTSVSAEFWA
jgi:hypothetical protein